MTDNPCLVKKFFYQLTDKTFNCSNCPLKNNGCLKKKQWIKARPATKKSQKFICPICTSEVYCVCNNGKENVCNYIFCPYCGEKILTIKSRW